MSDGFGKAEDSLILRGGGRANEVQRAEMRERARRYADRDQWTAARTFFEQQLNSYPVDAEAHAHFGFFSAKESAYDTDKALKELDLALKLDRDCALAHLYRAIILGNIEDEKGAWAALEEARRCGAPEADLEQAAGWICLDIWKLDRAISHLQKLVELRPTSTSMIILSQAFSQNNDNETAVQWARKARDQEPDDYRAWTYTGAYLGYMGLFDEARRELVEALRLGVPSPLLYYTAGYIEYEDGKLDQAESMLRKALDVDPLYVTTRKLLGDICARTGRTDEAREHYKKAIEQFPDYKAAKEALAVLPR